jgi:hypothetical protein
MSGADPVVSVGVLFDERTVVVGADQRARVARDYDDRQRAEDGVDGAPFEPELAQVGPGEQRVRCL